ncbi:hypothetical protein M0Q50_04280 [bacterium]|jgi:hypothetical protein|nr:hypothetical protein [bacterium]
MKKIEIDKISNWNIAKKTKNIKAKPSISLMVDRSVLSKFLIDTLEGKEPLGDGSVICLGDSNDIWQQMPKKLIQKYNIIDVDKDGWMICEPRPDNSVECIEITKDVSCSGVDLYFSNEEFFIFGQWGEEVSILDTKKYIQRADIGDFICRNREDKTDVWIVKRKIFLNTYNIING